MKKSMILVAALLPGSFIFSQQTAIYRDEATKFKEAKEFFQKEQYSLAYPLLKELQRDVRETDVANYPVTVQEVNYYAISCALLQNEGTAPGRAAAYIHTEKNNARVQMLNFQLGEYYFRQQDFAKAVSHYEEANIANLSNKDISALKFHQGYAYFTLGQFAKAKPLFNTIRSLPEDPHYLDANYYYGFLAFKDKQYAEALKSFKLVENEDPYAAVVPYYIAQLYYIQGKKAEALAYAEQKIKTGKSQYYDLELKQMIGHAYFERKEFDKALPYLADYVKRSDKVRREDLYELSYSYYQANQLDKAIEGFKQLSGKEDTLSQSAMYLLGDAYLKTGQKTNARNAFLFCALNSSDRQQQEISKFQYAKLSYELGYQDEALKSLQDFISVYPNSLYNTEAKDLLVAVLTNTNNFRQALELLDQMDNPTPNAKRLYPRILYGRATELINDDRLAAADALLDKAIADPNGLSVLGLAQFWKGEIAYRSNRIDDAIRYYHSYLGSGAMASGDANARTVNYNLGYSYLRKENYSAALGYFEPLGKGAGLSADAFIQDAYIRTADCYYMLNNYAKAKAMYDNVAKYSWPSEDYAVYQSAMISGIKSPGERIRLLKEMIRKFPSSALVTDANMEIAKSYIAQENFNDAIPYLNAVIKSGGNTSLKPDAHLKLGVVYYNINNNAAALDQYKAIIDQYPNSPQAEDALENARVIYLEQGKTDEYADFMRKAGKPLTVSAEDSLNYAAAETQYNSGDKSNAFNAFTRYLERFPGGSYAIEAHYYRGEIYNERKDFAKALADYEFVAEKAPNKFAENAILGAARISFFEQKSYEKAAGYYQQLRQIAAGQENKLEAMRGLLRSQYQLKRWSDAVTNAKELVATKGSSADDKALANMAIAKSHQVNGEQDPAITNFRSVVQLNKGALAAEARYEIAASLLAQNKLAEAEKAGFEVINKSGSYDYWLTKAYILLGDVYFRQKDYFNAKATYESVVENASDAELKKEAQTKLAAATAEEKAGSKIGG